MSFKQYLPLVVVAVVFAGAGFFTGIKYQQNKVPAAGQYFRQFGSGTNGMQGNRAQVGQNSQRLGNGMRPVTGTITAADDKSITVSMQDGSSRIVFLSANTQINKAETVSASDLKSGETVVVFGSQNNDGSVTALNIQLNPELRGSNQNR